MSASYGFALSSAAVLGIVLFAERLAGAFERAMPHGIAEMMAMTVAAQLFTLPIQVLMDRSCRCCPCRELLVSPFVGLATMAGLMALACAWCEPWLAGVFAWISSWGHAGDGTGGVVAGWQHDGRHPMERWRYGCRADCGGGNRYRHATGVRQPLPPACPSL